MDVVCVLPSHAQGNIIFTDGVTFYLQLNVNCNLGSFSPPVEGMERSYTISGLDREKVN